MIKQMVFATNNAHKLEEVRAILSDTFTVLSLKEIGCEEEIPETGSTLEENALIKARWVKEKFGFDCFSDDTGLEVDALNGAPGVISARYAGEEKSAEANMNKLIDELSGVSNRKARFRTVIAWVDSEQEKLIDGSVYGEIISDKRGGSGFGYDPIFVPDGYTLTFAELGNEEKNRISHRARAVEALKSWLDSINK